ncbi:pentapeptide repeat-containing protein [Nocardioides ochotonae]|uniref:pentapeptide repeat-containing protein n=1 Tax=Nocardioides ochotonae TaxID=2685869 RepID=UPI001409EDD0|nr:pentapeptide repeat-containing protein [Nocardioides ochotonae]
MPPARKSTRPPQIDDLRLGTLAEGDPADLRRNADLESVRYADLTLHHLDLTGAVLASTQLSSVSADETDLKGARLSEVHLDRVVMPVVRAARGQWRDVRVSGRLGSLEAYESQWRSVHFVGCKLSFVNLRGAELLDVAFTDCLIEELDLSNAKARRVRLADSRVGQLDVRGSTLSDLDLRGADLAVVDGLLDLRGATVSPDQLARLAPALADALGIRVER